MATSSQYRSWIAVIGLRAAVFTLALATLLTFLAAVPQSARAQGYAKTVLLSFDGADGENPNPGLVRDAQGNLYGSTFYGGASGEGTVFKVDASGNETVLHSFSGSAGNASDGGNPLPGLALDAQGNLYGTTKYGGSCNCGTVFKVDAKGTETVLYNFTDTGTYSGPNGGLVLDAQGNLYGTTPGGGTYNKGTVFKVDTAGNETVVYSFMGIYTKADGAVPLGGLAQDAQDIMYGVTQAGGDYACDGTIGCGTVFKVDATGNETVLYSFTGTGGDGSTPLAGLALDAQGNLYGTTAYGGASCSTCGTVFKVDPTGKETVLYSFTLTDGAAGQVPNGGLTLDAQGNVYGTTMSGGSDLSCRLNGASGCGTVFKVDTVGNETVLYSFVHGTGLYVGSNGGLLLDAQGNLYGTTTMDGASWVGTLYKLKPAPSTTTTLTAVPNSPTYGQSVTLTAVVTSSAGAPPNGENVIFQMATGVLGTDASSGGTASFTTSNLAAGTNPITAFYVGDQNLAGSVSQTLNVIVSKAATTTSLVSSVNPSNIGQTVLFTATVTPEFGGSPVGTVTFYDGATALQQVPLTGEVAAFSTDILATGTHNITAVFGGYGNFLGSTSNVMAQVVTAVKVTTIVLTASPNPSVKGGVVNFTAAVSSPMGGTPTGKVTFYKGTAKLATATLNGSGVASYATSALPVAPNSITAVYAGDSNYGGSTSVPVIQVVLEPTTSTLSSSPNPSTYGQTVTLITVINSTIGAPPNGEAINLFQAKSTLGVADLSGGTAIFATTKLHVGKNLITALYNGDSTFLGSTSNVVTQMVGKATTSTSLLSSQDPSNSGQSVTFTATVMPQFSGTVTGKISFYDGTTLLKTESLTKGAAKLTTSTLAPGSHTVTATYDGTAAFVGSSAALTQIVN